MVYYGVAPALPTGLSLNTTTGVISGTPSATAASAIYIITAANAAGNTTAELNITVNPLAPSVALNTVAATMDPGAQRVFTANVVGLDSQAVTWSTSPANSGVLQLLDVSGVAYTAPATAGTVELTATSTVDNSVKATVIITIRATPALVDTIFNNLNPQWVSQGSPNPTTFTIGVGRHITYFDTYHWNNGGVLPGQLSLKHSDGTIYGPWQTTGMPGQGGALNASWVCYPEVDIKAGTYTVIDSSPETWSYDSASGNAGFSSVKALSLGF